MNDAGRSHPTPSPDAAEPRPPAPARRRAARLAAAGAVGLLSLVVVVAAGPVAAASATTPPGAPSAPSDAGAMAGYDGAQVLWTVGPDGGLPISSFVITPTVNGVAQTPVAVPATAPGTALDPTPGASDQYDIAGLPGGQSVSFTIAAANASGTGPASSPSGTATTSSSPLAPYPPGGLGASVAGTTVTVQWTVPADNGSPISSFTIYAESTFDPASQSVTVPAGAPGSPTSAVVGAQDSYAFADLDEGVQYTFMVGATNGVGMGHASLPTAQVMPVGDRLGPVGSSHVSFGSIRVGDVAGPLQVAFVNTGTAAATITDAQFAGNGANDFLVDTTCTDVAPNQSCEVDVYFLPGTIGFRQATVTLIDGTATPPTLTLDGTGTEGYYEVTSQGVVHPFGDAVLYGSTGSVHLNKPIVASATTPNGAGYWLVASDGGIFAFGDAGFYGSTGAMRLDKPIVGMVATPDGGGYWLVASDGGIFAFGDAGFYGSTGAMRLAKPIVGMAATSDGGGYWLVASDGGIFAFGDAQFYGSTGAMRLNKPIVGMAPVPDGHGYWLVASDGGIFSFGDAQFYGSTGAVRLAKPIVGMAASPDGQGYWLVASDGGIFAFGDAPFDGSTGGQQATNIIGLVGTAPPTLQATFDFPA